MLVRIRQQHEEEEEEGEGPEAATSASSLVVRSHGGDVKESGGTGFVRRLVSFGKDYPLSQTLVSAAGGDKPTVPADQVCVSE